MQRQLDLRPVLDAVPVPMLVVDSDRTIVEANSAAVETYGYSRDELVGLRIEKLAGPSVRDRVEERVKAARDGRTTFSWQHVRRDGSVFPVEITAQPLAMAGEEWFLSCVHDMTEHEAALKALEEEKERFRAVFEGVSVGTAEVGLDFTLRAANRAYCEMLGYSESEIEGRHLREITHPESAPENLRLQEQLAAGEIDHYRMEKQFIHRDGHTVYGILDANLVRDSNGAPSYFLGSVIDISDRKRAETELDRIRWMLSAEPVEASASRAHEHDQGYGDLTELNRDGLILRAVGREQLAELVGEFLDLLHTSSAVYEIDGAYAFGIFTSGWCRLMDRASRRLCQIDDNAEALASGRWLCHESCWTECSLEAIRRGAAFDVACRGGIRMYAVPIFANGEVVGAINLGYGDPPRERQPLGELAALYEVDADQLEKVASGYLSRPPYIIELAKRRLHSVARTIGALVERSQAEQERQELSTQLQQAQKMETVGRLAGGVAHDFNNMLGVILGRAEMALHRLSEEDPTRSSLEEIRRAAERSAQVTRQLLAFARRQMVTPEVVNVNRVIEDHLELLRRLIGESIDVVWRPDSELWSVKIDPVQLHQVLTNLVVNSRDAIVGVGTITIETNNQVANAELSHQHAGAMLGEMVAISVSDTGCGMLEETRMHAFEPFFTTREIGQGSGLGLATVYGVVKQNGGFCELLSEPGCGTTVRIYLPRWVDAVGSEKAAASEAGVAEGSRCVLVVEDEPAILRLTAELLSGLGYEVLQASTPSEALRIAHQRTSPIDLLLTDVVMPEMNGCELARQIQQQHQQMVRVFMSGYTADVVSVADDEKLRFLQKPFTLSQLAGTVKAALGQ